MIIPGNIEKLTFWNIGNYVSSQDEKNPLLLYLWGIFPKCFEDVNKFIQRMKEVDKDAAKTIKYLQDKGAIEFSKEIDWDKYE